MLPALAEGHATHARPTGRGILVWKALYETNQHSVFGGATAARRLTEEKLLISSSKELQFEGSALGGSTGCHPDAVLFKGGDAQFGGIKSTTDEEEEMLLRCG